MKPVEAVLIGAGQRGIEAMGAFAERCPDELKFVAVVEPIKERRDLFAERHNIPEKLRFASLDEFLAQPAPSKICFNATMDRQHRETAIKLMENGFHQFLEKPMDYTAEGCLAIADKARENGLMLQICHPLRYTDFYSRVKNLIRDGAIGKLVSFTMNENVCYWHFAHSYTRGNWRNSDKSGPIILTKSCHDMDIAAWLTESAPKKVAAFGGLDHFRKKNAPEGATKRCTDGCPAAESCPFYAPDLYLKGGPLEIWPVSMTGVIQEDEKRLEALKTSHYGRCVYHCDNNVPDHFVLSSEFENGVSFDFTLRADTYNCYRTIRAVGTEGTLDGHFENFEIRISRFTSKPDPEKDVEDIHTEKLEGAHGGGDTGAIRNFVNAARENDVDSLKRSVEIAVEGHMLAFAAEEARTSEQVITLSDFKKRFRG